MASSRPHEPGPVLACIVGSCHIRLWRITSRERLGRQLRDLGVDRLVERAEAAQAVGCSVLLLRADHLFDKRILQGMVLLPSSVLEMAEPRGSRVRVAAHVPPELVDWAADTLAAPEDGSATRSVDLPTGLTAVSPGRLVSDYDDELLKSDAGSVLPITGADQHQLERRLFDGSYKGITDLVTKWIWPVPALWVTRACAALGITPNAVTMLSVLLVVAVTLLFARGIYGPGLLLAWLMTFLDTVDGKLARVTVQSTPIGHALDKGLDLIHPPFWYLAWGIGLGFAGTPLANPTLAYAAAGIVLGYIVGRLAEGAFSFWLARFSMFCWRPIDSHVRLVLARRNPNLLLLSAGWLIGRPDLGLLAVALWTVASSAFLLVRLGMAAATRLRGGELEPWIAAAPVSRSASPLVLAGSLASEP